MQILAVIGQSWFLVPSLPSRIHGDPYHRRPPLPDTKAHQQKIKALFKHQRDKSSAWLVCYFRGNDDPPSNHQRIHSTKHSQTLSNPIRQLIFRPTWSDMIKWDVCNKQQGGTDKRHQMVFGFFFVWVMFWLHCSSLLIPVYVKHQANSVFWEYYLDCPKAKKQQQTNKKSPSLNDITKFLFYLLAQRNSTLVSRIFC